MVEDGELDAEITRRLEYRLDRRMNMDIKGKGVQDNGKTGAGVRFGDMRLRDKEGRGK